MTTRAEVVTEARKWLETPFHHQARLRGVGVDCIGLVIGVARALALVSPEFDIVGYSRTPDGKTLMLLAGLHMRRLDAGDPLLPGHIVVVDFAAHPQHFGIVAERGGNLSMIHAAGKIGKVIETRLWFHPGMRFAAAFELPGVTD